MAEVGWGGRSLAVGEVLAADRRLAVRVAVLMAPRSQTVAGWQAGGRVWVVGLTVLRLAEALAGWQAGGRVWVVVLTAGSPGAVAAVVHSAGERL